MSEAVSAVGPVVEDLSQSLAGGFDLVWEGTEALENLVPLLDDNVVAVLAPIVRGLRAGLELLDLGIVGGRHE